jgi:modification methylase
MQDLGFWFLNDVLWIKTNPMPNFRGVRFTNAHETLLWAAKAKGQRYTFNHFAMKSLNDGLQMRSDWYLPICSGAERVRVNGKKAHSTQKPEALLYRVILASSNPGEVVLDPFFGSGTTGVVARKLHRNWIGIEKDPEYVALARSRIDSTPVAPFDSVVFDIRSPKLRQGRLPFSRLLEEGKLTPGQSLFFLGDLEKQARIKPDGKLLIGDFEGSIHQAGRHLLQGSPCNGWETWYYQTERGELRRIDELRQQALGGESSNDLDG